MEIETFKPIPRLVTKETRITEPAFPAIDAHNHLAQFGGHWDQRDVSDLLRQLDLAHITHYVDLDGGWGEDVLDAHLRKFKDKAPDRFTMFAGPNWKLWSEVGNRFGEVAADRFRKQIARGAKGLKIWKNFGLHEKDDTGKLVAVDDQRLDPLWQAAGELNQPVLVHVADPVAFFEPRDATNERWDELGSHPDWHFPSPPFPSFMAIMEAWARLVKRHPETTFIGAHVACYAENLDWVSQLMDNCPNLVVDFSARIAELGRQPFAARRFFEKYQDRILFGIDAGPDLETYHMYYRFLETDDEYFNYNPHGAPGQGRWHIYGLHLPKPVLEKIYVKNARKLFQLD